MDKKCLEEKIQNFLGEERWNIVDDKPSQKLKMPRDLLIKFYKSKFPSKRSL